MSTEVETKADSETPAVTPVSSVARPKEPATWRRRRYQVIGGAVAIALIAAFVANTFLAHQYSPAGAVSQYLGAIQSGNGTAAWSSIQVSAPTTKVDANLTDRAALQAALSSGKLDLKSFAITSTSNASASLAVVNFSYETSGGTKQGTLSVERSGETSFGFYPVWHVVITPTVLRISLSQGSSGVSVDGKAIALPSGAKSAIAVLPLAHKIRFIRSQMLEGQTVAVDGFTSPEQNVAYQPSLTSAGLAAAKTAIKSAFDACAKSTTFTQDGCPQRYDAYFARSPQWQLVGDPLQDVTISFDQDLNASGIGHYQMEIAYQEAGSPGTHHDLSSGGYRAQLLIAATSVAVGSIRAADGLPALQRPAGASDQAAKDLVSKALTACAGVQLQSPPDCPQQLISAGVSNVRWTLSGDPLADATVTFDQKSGVFTVHGRFAMSATYDFLGNAENTTSFYPAYTALLCWDGQALVLVTIQGADSHLLSPTSPLRAKGRSEGDGGCWQALKSSGVRCAKLAHHDGPNVRLWRKNIRRAALASE
jgi:hypothetical protein